MSNEQKEKTFTITTDPDVLNEWLDDNYDKWMNDETLACETNCPLAGDCAPNCEGAFY